MEPKDAKYFGDLDAWTRLWWGIKLELKMENDSKSIGIESNKTILNAELN